MYSKLIKSKAIELGFAACGIAKASELTENRDWFKNWLNQGLNGDMRFFENNLEKRLNPQLLEEGTASVISVLISYFPNQLQNENSFKIAKYAYGHDYHQVIKKKLFILEEFIKENVNQNCKTRIFVDSAPVLEKAWAVKSGLGWIGKNTLLINKEYGSFTFLGEILTDIELEYDSPSVAENCGTCTKCIDACPTQAIVKPYIIDAKKCISYLTIESHREIPIDFKGKLNNRIFGCDICQDACPWNKNLKPSSESSFHPHPELLSMEKKDWKSMDEERFYEIFKNTPLERIGFEGLKKNINFV